MSKDKPETPAEKVKAMTIETMSADFLARQGLSGSGQQSTFSGKGDEWLAALERASFAVTDDRIKAPTPPKHTAAYQLNEQVPQVPKVPSASSSALPGTGQPVARQAGTVKLPIPPRPVIPNMAAPGTTGRAPAAPVPGNGGPRSAQGLLAQSLTRLGGNAPGVPHGYQALLNQASFMDLNLQLTHSSTGPVLWIRDFKQKYSQELIHWTRDLEAALAEQGQSLSRIMLNGQPINHITDILGR